jgi:hypothetical protein
MLTLASSVSVGPLNSLKLPYNDLPQLLGESAPMADEKLTNVFEIVNFNPNNAYILVCMSLRVRFRLAPQISQEIRAHNQVSLVVLTTAIVTNTWITVGLDVKTLESPSIAASTDSMTTHQTVHHPEAIYNGRPANLTGPPISVYHPIFSQFQSMVQIELDAFIYETHDLVAAERLIEIAPTYFEDDQTRQDATAPIFEHFLKGACRRSVELRSGGKLYKPDGLNR